MKDVPHKILKNIIELSNCDVENIITEVGFMLVLTWLRDQIQDVVSCRDVVHVSPGNFSVYICII